MLTKTLNDMTIDWYIWISVEKIYLIYLSKLQGNISSRGLL